MKLSPKHVRTFDGFGGMATCQGYHVQPQSESALLNVLDLARQSGRPIVLRGAGRSYGDAAVLPEAIVLDLAQFNELSAVTHNQMTVGAGVTIDRICREALPQGYWPPVVSGTAFPTLAGALAMNIHGKNAFKAGTLGEHVTRMRVLLPSGRLDEWTPSHPEFWNVIGGAGGLAIILEATLNMVPVVSPMLNVRAHRVKDWAEQFAVFERELSGADYVVSWVDLYGGGRGLIHAANYSPSPQSTVLPEPKASRIAPHVWRALRLFNHPSGMRLINHAKYFAGRFEPAETRAPLPDFHFLLDRIPNWQRAYGKSGFLQFQIFAPASVAPSLFPMVETACAKQGFTPFLGVLKRHKPSPSLLSYSPDGYSLALDFPNWLRRPGFRYLLDQLIDMTLQADGRFYFAKDQVLRADQVRQMMGDECIAAYRDAKARLDPDGLLASSLLSRVGLLERVS